KPAAHGAQVPGGGAQQRPDAPRVVVAVERELVDDERVGGRDAASARVRGERSSAAYTEPDELAGVLARRRAQALPLPVERAARECERPAGLERVERAAHGAG